jgi:hypothetical protein
MPAHAYCRPDDVTSIGELACEYSSGDVADTLSETAPTLVKMSAGRGDLTGLASTLASRVDPNTTDAWLRSGQAFNKNAHRGM